MEYNTQERITVINNLVSTLNLFKDEIQSDTNKNDIVSSLYVRLSKKNDTFLYGDIKLLYVTDENGGELDRRLKARQIDLSNDEITINEYDDSYIYDGYLYSVPMSYPNDNYPYYISSNGTVNFSIPENCTQESLYSNYIFESDSTVLSDDKSNIIKNGLKVILDDLYYFSKEKNPTSFESMIVSNEAILSLKGILNYIDAYIVNMNYELERLNEEIDVSSIEELVADVFDLKSSFDTQDTTYAGMVDELYIGFGLYVENQTIPSCASSNIQEADVEKLDSIYPNWRAVVNIEELTCNSNSTDDEVEIITYKVYRLDYDKTMKLPPRVLIPLVSMFITISMSETKHCEFDELIIYIIAFAVTIATAQPILAKSILLGLSYIVLSFITILGIGSDDLRLIASIALLVIGGLSSWDNIASNGYGALEVLSFSVSLSNNIFNLYAEYDLSKMQKDADELANEVEELEEELDLSDTQDKIEYYIYDLQYTQMYDRFYEDMFDVESSLYMGDFSLKL